ncbi:TPA: hypothetical protein QCY18_003827 [Bacillus cereus]|uniref:hypothetical protein n=1 Tax=Bacillus TaxID=1386 RepID=UPI0001A01168|nr:MULTISPECIES: hypothetical protein [Bacillus]EEK75512.1 hypothetical protein bcere0009_56460 [Bacillus cereus R309803]MED2681653.1 hypothetical protein [Bacillus thuringiensis]HDR4563401.1 hypothetical protein [Bacillus luti]AYF06567.1 hypothetical protein MLA2C4_13130 [Bacillus mobilis]MBF8115962.1 hypothetical protein [Bacillus cereus]
METKTTTDGNTFFIEVDQKKSSTKEKFSRKASLVFGIFGILFSVILGITIVGLFFAVPLFLFSLGFIYAAFEKQEVQCPNCNYKRRISKGNGHFDCGSCKKRTLVKWRK